MDKIAAKKQCTDIVAGLFICYSENYLAELKRRRQGLEDLAHPGRLVTVTTPEMFNKVHRIVVAERRVTGLIASTVEITFRSYGRACNEKAIILSGTKSSES